MMARVWSRMPVIALSPTAAMSARPAPGRLLVSSRQVDRGVKVANHDVTRPRCTRPDYASPQRPPPSRGAGAPSPPGTTAAPAGADHPFPRRIGKGPTGWHIVIKPGHSGRQAVREPAPRAPSTLRTTPQRIQKQLGQFGADPCGPHVMGVA